MKLAPRVVAAIKARPQDYPSIEVRQTGICICCGLPTLVAEGVSGVQWNLCRGNPVQEWEDAA